MPYCWNHWYRTIENLFKRVFVEQKNKITQFTQRLIPPKVLISNLVSKQQLLDTKFKNYLENILTNKETKLNSISQLLESSSFNRVLDRGFTLVMDNNGKPIKLSSDASENANVKIKFADETRSARLDTWHNFINKAFVEEFENHMEELKNKLNNV